MFQKLDIFEKRFDELNNRLYDPSVASNAELYSGIMKELKSIEPIVEKYKEYQQAVQTLDDAKQMLSEGVDDEFKAMLDDEISEARVNIENISSENTILSRDTQFSKALSPMDVTVSGISMDCRFVQS